MKNKITILIFISFSIGVRLFSQTNADTTNSPSKSTYSNIICLTCPGSNWDSTANIEANDGHYANVLLAAASTCIDTNCYYSRSLIASGFGFHIPLKAAILGIKVEILRNFDIGNCISDSIVELAKNEVGISSGSQPVGNNYASSTLWNKFNGPIPYISYGGSSDEWGVSWAPADINSSNFGVFFAVKNTNSKSTPTAKVDHIRITVTYSTLTGVESEIRSVSDFLVCNNKAENSLELSFDLETNSNSAISIYNMIGQLQFSKELRSLPGGKNKQTIDVSNFIPGIYFVRLSANGGELVRKVMIF